MKGKKTASSLVVSLSLAASLVSIPAYAAGPNEKVVQTPAPAGNATQMIVKFKNTAPKLKDYHVDESSVGGDRSLVSVNVPKDKSLTTAIKELKSRTDVQYVEPDYKLKLSSAPNDPLYSRQWFHQAIHTDEAWNSTKGSSSVIVAVIDDGIDLTHPDLKNQIISPYDAVKQTNQSIPDGEHGTHVAGIIAAGANNGIGGAGVAPNVKIMPINVFSQDSTGQEAADTSDVISGIEYAINHGAKIISMSLGEYQNSTALNDEIQKAYQKGLLIVAAAGNDHTSQKSYPAADDHVISVTSVDKNEQVSSFSNYGDTISLAAPGSNILSTLPGGGYGYMSGTSMATPVVSGVAALVWSKNPTYTNAQVANDLFQSADDLGTPGKDPVYGYGEVDAAKALGIKILSQPTVNPVKDKDTVLTGKVSSDVTNGTVVVSNAKGELGRATVDSNFNFSVNIPAQAAGTKLSVRVIDSQNNQSEPLVVSVGTSTVLTAPTVDQISDQSTVITGTTTPNAFVNVKGGFFIYRGVADANGQFKIRIIRPTAGSVFTIFTSDRFGNKGPATQVIVIDKTPPFAPLVYPVSSQATTVTGFAEANSTITVSSGNTVIGTAVAGTNNSFVVTIPAQTVDTTLTIVSTDKAGNQSKETSVMVSDKTQKPAPRYRFFSNSAIFQAFINMFGNL